MTASSFARLAALVFAVVGLLHLLRALMGWPVLIGSFDLPMWTSWLGFVVAAVLAGVGMSAARR